MFQSSTLRQRFPLPVNTQQDLMVFLEMDTSIGDSCGALGHPPRPTNEPIINKHMQIGILV
jgi:hypothetical protein